MSPKADIVVTIDLFPKQPVNTDDEGKIRFLKQLVLTAFSELDNVTFNDSDFVDKLPYRPAIVNALVKDYVYDDVFTHTMITYALDGEQIAVIAAGFILSPYSNLDESYGVETGGDIGRMLGCFVSEK